MYNRANSPQGVYILLMALVFSVLLAFTAFTHQAYAIGEDSPGGTDNGADTGGGGFGGDSGSDSGSDSDSGGTGGFSSGGTGAANNDTGFSLGGFFGGIADAIGGIADGIGGIFGGDEGSFGSSNYGDEQDATDEGFSLGGWIDSVFGDGDGSMWSSDGDSSNTTESGGFSIGGWIDSIFGDGNGSMWSSDDSDDYFDFQDELGYYDDDSNFDGSSRTREGDSWERNDGTGGTALRPDLVTSATHAELSGSEFRFLGNVKNTGDSALMVHQGSEATVENFLLVDYACDGTVDEQKLFTSNLSYLNNNGSQILLSEYIRLSQSGEHCFAFETDVPNVHLEKTDRNNVSNWFNFTATEAQIAQSNEVPRPVIEEVTPVGDSIPLEPSGIMFEVRSLTSVSSDDNSQTARQYIGNSDWSTEDISIDLGQHVAFKWDAPGYDSCVTTFVDTQGAISGNTEQTNINLSEPARGDARTYQIRCSGSNGDRTETITVAVE